MRYTAFPPYASTPVASPVVRPAAPRWTVLPPTPMLSNPLRCGYVPIDGVKIWYAIFGHGDPVVLLHGGLANSAYWGNQIPVLARYHRVIVIDARGHGRSTRDARPLTHRLMATDVIGVMAFLKIDRAAIVGWSDGANVGLDIAMNHPDRLTRLFAFAGRIDSRENIRLTKSPAFDAYFARAASEYVRISPTPSDYASFVGDITVMWSTQPAMTADQLRRITAPTWIVDGDHDEAVSRQHTLTLADGIPAASLLIQPGVGHFAFLQDAKQFNQNVLHFLE